jgi:hypothetical protein
VKHSRLTFVKGSGTVRRDLIDVMERLPNESLFVKGHTERSSHDAFCVDGFSVRIYFAGFERTWQKANSAFRQYGYG